MKKSFHILALFLFVQSLFAQNIPHANFNAPWGLQVNTYNGNLYFDRTDLVIPNQGLSINFEFAYNSFRDSVDIGFGKGWTSNYNFLYETLTTDSMVVERGDGRRDVFVQNGSGYDSPVGIFDRWEEYSSGQFKLTSKYGMQYFFDDSSHGRLTKMEDTNGNQVILSYTGGELATITDQSGRVVTLSWDNGHLVSLIDANANAQRTINYDFSNGFLSAVTDAEGYQANYSYDALGTLNHISNEKGDELQIGYNQNGGVSELITCIAYLTFTYNPEVRKTYVTQKNNDGDRVTTYIYDEEGKLIQKTGNCCGFNTQYQYDDDNNVSVVTDANSNEYNTSHDGMGNALLSTDADGANQSFTFNNTLNRLESMTDKKGNAISLTYDANGNLESLLQPEGVNTQLAYDPSGNITSLTDGNGNVTTMSYNPNNDVTSAQYPIGSESFQYDAVGNLLSSTDGNGDEISYSYDLLNRLESVTDALGNNVQYDYDQVSNLTEEMDPNGNTKSFDYDAHQRLNSVTTPSGTTQYGYDASDNLTSISDANDHQSSYEYDVRDLLISERDPLGNTTTYTYDGNGNILTRTDANNETTYYSYDNLNRLLSKSYNGDTDNYNYDINGNLIQTSNSNMSMSFTYDDLNRLTSKTIDNWGLTISYEYDFVGNRTKMTEPGGITLYTYDANNRLTSLTNPAGETTQFTYDNGNRITQQDHHNGTYSEYSYDTGGRLTSLLQKSSANAILDSYAYTYDANGNRLTMTTPEGTATYTYDGDNRLMTVVYDGIVAPNETYGFDATGNRMSLNGTNYTYDAADRIQSAESISYDFDANGNMIRKTDATEITMYEYDGENRLKKVTLPNGSKVDYQYDPFGNRISQSGAGGTKRYLLDGDNVLLELDNNGTTLARYTSGLGMDTWISMERNGQSYFYHTDGLGSVKALTNSGETVAATYSYDAYGNVLSTTGAVENPYTYTGREWEAVTGLYYYRTRFYDARVGRFLTKDKFPFIRNLPSTMNRYVYVADNPVNYSDPEGELFFIPIIAAYITKAAVVAFVGTAALGTVTSVIDQIGDLESIGGKIDCGKAIVDGIDEGITESWDPTKKIKKGEKLIKKGAGLLLKKKTFKKGLKQVGKGTAKYVDGSVRAGAYDSAKDYASEAISFNCNPFSPGSQEEEKEDSPPSDGGSPPDDGDITIPIVRAIDPNEIISPQGCGNQKWVTNEETLPYTILFENDPDFATAPAQTVVIEHIFDDDLNPFSFRLGDFGFGDYYFEVPDNVSYYNTQIDLSDSLGVLLAVTAGLDINNNKAFWILESRDPLTGLPNTLDASVGFLLVNDSLTHVGEGFVNFIIQAKNDSPTADTIHAQADIIFDDNPAIITNVDFNLIDADHPVSMIDDINILPDDEYLLTWSGTDVGSGLTTYLLYVSTDGGPFLPIADDLSNNTYTFAGVAGSTYQFFTIAIDCAGNVEPLKDSSGFGCVLNTTTSMVQPTGMDANGSISISVIGSAGNTTYEWSPDVSSDSVATNLVAGIYNITITDVLGCSATLELQLDSMLVSVVEAEKESGLFIHRLFPSPAETIVNLEFTAPSKIVWLEVFTPDGKQVAGRSLVANPGKVNKESLEVSGWAAGSYLVRIRTRKHSVSAVFVKQ